MRDASVASSLMRERVTGSRIKIKIKISSRKHEGCLETFSTWPHMVANAGGADRSNQGHGGGNSFPVRSVTRRHLSRVQHMWISIFLCVYRRGVCCACTRATEDCLQIDATQSCAEYLLSTYTCLAREGWRAKWEGGTIQEGTSASEGLSRWVEQCGGH